MVDLNTLEKVTNAMYLAHMMLDLPGHLTGKKLAKELEQRLPETFAKIPNQPIYKGIIETLELYADIPGVNSMLAKLYKKFPYLEK